MWLRRQVWDLVMGCQRGHVPSSYSMNEILVSLFYGGIIKDRPVTHPDRDRVIISKGHASLALYPILAERGAFPASEIKKYTKSDGLLRMYADPSIPGIESVTGSLGHGLGVGCGYAWNAKLANKDYNTYIIIGDGECYEGSIWESALFAAHYKLTNLCTIVDRNQLCIIGETEKCIKLDSITDKFRAFGWDAVELDGHKYSQLMPALERFNRRENTKPLAIIANTVKGKGVSYMEGSPNWHNKMPTPEQVQKALADLAVNPITE